jgi:DNA polymerase
MTLLKSSSSLTKMRTQVHDYHGIPMVATYHPAALLRNPNWKRPAWEDVQKLRALYDELGGRS